MSFDFGLGDIGGGISDFFTNTIPGWFSGGSSTPSASSTSSDLSTPSTGGFFSSTPSTSAPTRTTTPSSAPASSAPSVSPSLISQFLSPTTTTSAASAPDTGFGNTDSVLSTAGGASSASPSSPGTVSQIMSALGLDKTSTGDLLKGALGLGGLGYAVSKNTGSTPAQKSVEQLANQQNQQGQQLEGYLANGTLPPGAQAYVDQQVGAQKSAIRSKYANLGMTGSTAEIQELNNVESQAATQMFEIASQLYNTGVTQTGASSQLYEMLINAQNSDNSQVGNAISNFVSALGGGSPAKV